jgi:hypothetical protein
VCEFHPIVYNGYLLGGSKGSKWLQASEVIGRVKGGEKYRLYGLGNHDGDAIGGKGEPPIETEPSTEMVEIDFTKKNTETDIAINGSWNALPRVPARLSNSSESYRKIVAELLKQKGLKNINVNIKQIFKIDLEGDGADEVLISAENVTPLSTEHKKDTYSILILRKAVNGKIENIALRQEVYLKDEEFSEGPPYLHTIESICDANGDGIMELLLSTVYYEGDYYELVRINGNKCEPLIGNGIEI